MVDVSKEPLVKISIRNGLIAGVISVVLLIVMYYMGQHPLMISPYFDFRVFLLGIFIFFTLREIRDNQADSVLFFWQAMVSSVLVVLVATIIGSLGLLVLATLEPRFLSSYVEGMTQYLKGFPEEEVKKIGRDVYERNLELLPSTNRTGLMITYFGQGIIIGLFVSIILSAILRRQPKTP
ncbi:MAG TPA: DUF4199 domain-containing protein [Cyclobacteriaceae bacterium]|nr:DUF4199 domain-containing protein [Cyclobacteriaceae bacterium]